MSEAVRLRLLSKIKFFMMDSEKKSKRPRIGASAQSGNAEKGGTEGRYEKVNYPNDEHAADRQNRNYGDRQGYQQRNFGYQNRQGGFQNRNFNNFDRQGYNQQNFRQPASSQESDTVREEDQNSENTFQQEGYQPRQTYQPRQQGYQPRQQGYQQRQNNGYNRQRQGNYQNNQQGGYNNMNRQGYQNRNQQGGYNNMNRQGYQNRNQQGGYNNMNRQGYQNRNQQGGYNNQYNQGGFRKQNNMKFMPRPKQIDYVLEDIDPNEEIRLNKYMSNAGICSRREADEYISKGLVKVNGEVVTELGTKIKRDDVVEYDEKVVVPERKCYVLLNKPKDCVTTSDDPNGRTTVLDIVKNACRERIYPVGRLDRNTTGVLLLTNDGDLASKLTHPKFVKKKIYHVWTDKDITEEDMQKIADGIELADGEIHADAISYVSETDRNQAGIEIHSGRNRIVRRIFEHLGYKVTKLDRVYFAGLTKKNLPRGRWRYLTQEEVNFLRMGSFE